jgi:hypothetical protein
MELPSEFHKRLQAEIARRRKEVQHAPEAELILILDWIQAELRNFSGYSANGRNGQPKKMPPEVLEYFRRQGSKGGKIGGRIGGKRSLETMTPEERSARAKKAAAAAVAVRAAKRNAGKKP